MHFTPIATQAELRDATSWVNTGFDWDKALYDELCRAMGEAIAAWAAVEVTLFAIYMNALRSDQALAAASLFETPVNFNIRLDVVDVCVRTSSAIKPDLDVWSKLHERASKRSKRRNDIAHMTMFYDHVNKNPNRKFFLSWSKYGKALDPRLHASDVDQIRDSFANLGSDLSEFWQTLSA